MYNNHGKNNLPLRRHTEEFIQMNLKNKTISFLGDSITEGCGASSVEKRFDEVLMEMA